MAIGHTDKGGQAGRLDMVIGGPKGDHHPPRKGKEYRVVEGRHRGSPRDRHHKDRPRELQAQRPRWRDPWHGRKDDGKLYYYYFFIST